MTQTYDVMILAAHPDDAEFGAAGTVARWTNEGREVVYVVCTNGDKGSGDRTLTPEQISAMRKKEQIAAADTLGVREVVFLDYPDQGLEDTPDLRKRIVRLIRTYSTEDTGNFGSISPLSLASGSSHCRPGSHGCRVSICQGSFGLPRFARRRIGAP